jgi:hypothetical protein
VYSVLCGWCSGRGYRHPKLEGEAEPSGPLAFFVEAGKPRTAHLTVSSILLALKGELRICDPYYGTGTLYRLDSIADKPIRFLTQKPDTKEQSTGVLPKAIAEFGKQHPNIEFRRHSTSDLHDRFVLSSTELVLLGHGLKDIGSKDSFVVRLNRDVAADTLDEVTASFDRKWAAATRLT